MTEGWIKLHRKIEHNWIWKDPRRALTFIHMLFRANYTETSVRTGKEILLVPRGSFVTSLRKFSEEIPLSFQETRTFIGLLEANTVINTRATQFATQITICNYEDYQDNQHIDPLESTQTPTTDKEDKEKEKKKNPPNPPGGSQENKTKNNPSLSPEQSLEYLPVYFQYSRFKNVWADWWKFRKSEGWTTKVSYMKTSLRNLDKLAGEDVVQARLIVEQSMDNGWQGLFSVKNGYQKPKPSHGTRKKGKYEQPVVEVEI